jgi:two-component system, NtrC family, sensor kinase
MLVVWMLLAIGAVTAIAWWDSRRESEAILQDLGSEQALVAAIAARDLGAHLAALPHTGRALMLHGHGSPDPAGPLEVRPADLLGSPAVEQPGAFRLFLAPPNESWLIAIDGGVVSSAPLGDAFKLGARSVRLDRAQAHELGLMARTAMAGIAHVDAGPLGQWGIAAVATAARQRDREGRAFWRFVLGVALATGLVLAFGGIALRNERRELHAQRALAVAAVERQRDEQLARAERVATMGTFAMGIVHEVSTPLGVIMGRAEQLRARCADDDRSVHAAQAIIGQVDRIQTIVRRFLDVARGGRPSLARTDPAELVRSAAASVAHRFSKAQVSLVTDAPAGGQEVHCDRPLLEQAIVNLLLNACDACSPGGRVELALRAEGERVAFVVTDDGVGIPPENAAQATDPFFTTKPAGTGLGLAIASEIAKSHRGDLSVAPNAAGRGTRACVEIPAAIPGSVRAS